MEIQHREGVSVREENDLEGESTVRFETMPGKQGQMDWGFFEDHLVSRTGREKLYVSDDPAVSDCGI